MTRTDPRLIVVVGMHRSGTSAITRGLLALGVDLGDDLMPAAPGVNEKGFYEDMEINRLNVELLNAFASDWDTLSILPEALFHQEKLAPFKLRAIELLRKKMGRQPFAFKDPRIGRLLPFWRSVFRHLDVQPIYIVAIRHPMSVALSLQTRDGFGTEKSHYLWLEHVLPAMLETSGGARVIVDFDLLMADPNAQLQRLAQHLGLPFDLHATAIKEYVNEFLDSNLRHAAFKFEDLSIDPSVPADVIRAFEILIRLGRDDISVDAPEVEDTFHQLSVSMQALSPALNYITRSDRSAHERARHIAGLTQGVTERDSEIANLRQRIVVQDGQIDEHGRAIVERDEQIRALDRTVAERDGQIRERDRAMAERDEHIAMLDRAVADRDGKIDALDAQIVMLNRVVTERDATIADLTDETIRRGAWGLSLDAELAETRARLDATTHSHSWRWTAPFRETRRWISSPRQQARRYISGTLRVAKKLRSRSKAKGSA